MHGELQQGFGGPLARRQLPAPMTAEQQEVYGWLGLNPALLLETPPESDNVLVRVVSPGEDPEAVLAAQRNR